MHPAYSVIFFTTASGAGYGLLAWLGLFGAVGLIEPGRWLGIIGFGTALGLISAGLLSSTAHLGRPERAWRAFSQWRSSWLSREGVAAIVTYLPAGLAAMGWVFWRTVSGPWSIALALSALGALVTLWCTGMIYASLKPIPAWHRPAVPWIYLVLGLATGALLLCVILALFGQPWGLAAGAALGSLAIGCVLKLTYWRAIDTPWTGPTLADATGLAGTVRTLDPPHTMDNFVQREMGYAIGRRHGAKLRRCALVALFAVPMVLLAGLLLLGGGFALPVLGLATISAALGILVERWLFFAQARHIAAIYYGMPEPQRSNISR